MKLKFLSGVCIGPGQDAEAGQIHEISDDNAKYFLNRGVAVKAEEIQEVTELSDHEDNAEEPDGSEEETPEHEAEEIQEVTGKDKTETKKGAKK